MVVFIRSCLRDGCYTTEYKSKQRHVVIVCQGYIIGVRRYRVKSSPLQVFCNQLVDKISVSKTLNMWVGGFFFWVVGLWPGSVFVVVLFAAGRFWWVLCSVCVIGVFRGFCQAWRPMFELWQWDVWAEWGCWRHWRRRCRGYGQIHYICTVRSSWGWMLQYARTEPEIGAGFAEVQGLRLLLDGVETGNLLSKLF